MEPGVDLDEGQRAVPGQDLEGGPAEHDPGDRDGPAWRRRQRRAVDGGRSAAALPGDRRPEAVPELDQLLDRRDPLVGQRRGELVDLPHPTEQLVSSLVGAMASDGRHPADHAVQEQVTADQPGRTAEVRRPAVHKLTAVEVRAVPEPGSIIVIGHRIASSS